MMTWDDQGGQWTPVASRKTADVLFSNIPVSVYTLILTSPYCRPAPASSQESFAISGVEITEINYKPSCPVLCHIISKGGTASSPGQKSQLFLPWNETDVKIKEMTLTSEVRRKCDCVTIHTGVLLHFLPLLLTVHCSQWTSGMWK